MSELISVDGIQNVDLSMSIEYGLISIDTATIQTHWNKMDFHIIVPERVLDYVVDLLKKNDINYYTMEAYPGLYNFGAGYKVVAYRDGKLIVKRDED